MIEICAEIVWLFKHLFYFTTTELIPIPMNCTFLIYSAFFPIIVIVNNQ